MPPRAPISLPVDPVLAGLRTALRTGTSAVLIAPPGAGKTTRVPRALLDAGLAGRGEIVVLEPRRLAARLAANGERVTVVARGEHLRAIAANGLRLETEESEITGPVEVASDLASLEGHDLVVLAVKAHQLTPIAAGRFEGSRS